jgi:diguanylate cyclase (GGDEF)-like protein/PAS domain S-box-containing protein
MRPSLQSRRWWDSIVFRSLAAVTLITVMLGGISTAFIRQTVADRAHNQAMERLGELLDTVESTARVASFANDEQLAREVALGLLRNSEVQRVTILSGNIELARAERSTKACDDQTAVRRMLSSPFKKSETIGEIRLDANWDEIFKRVEDNSRFAMLLLTAQLLLVIVGTAGMVFLVVVRPIKATSDRLHRLDATSGKQLTTPEGHENTEIGRLVDDINDLTGRLVATVDQERELRRQQEVDQRKYHDLFENASSGIFVAHADGRLISWNPAFVALTWLSASDSTRTRRLTDPRWDVAGKVSDLLHCSLTKLAPCADDVLLKGQRGDERWLHVAITPLGDGSAQGTITDVTARKREELSARRLAITDSLTGFANREGLLQTFAQLDPASEQEFALVMIDLNSFKALNDAMGFPVGDRLLVHVATRIRDAGRSGDYLARIGADEFVMILLGEKGREKLMPRIEALHTRLAEPYALGQGLATPLSISATLGIAFFPADGTETTQLLRGAELALNSARQSLRSHQFFDLDLQTAVEHRRRLEDDLRQAVVKEELRLAFQPIVDIHAGRLVGAEALLRWQHAERGFVSPEVFIPIAEEIGLIGDIGRHVLNDACAQLAVWRRDGLDMYVSVNVSARQIPDELTPNEVVATLQRHGLPPQAIVIEITEGVLMGNVAIAQRWIESLRAAGLRIYLDDFGTGYSSLSYLKRFPMDTVKIDKSFIRDMNADNSDRALVDAIITMAQSLDLKVVAEGIEEVAQLDLLREMGCGYGQGYLFSRPVPAADFVATAQRINSELAGRQQTMAGFEMPAVI